MHTEPNRWAGGLGMPPSILMRFYSLMARGMYTEARALRGEWVV